MVARPSPTLSLTAAPIHNSVRPEPVEACPEGTRRGPPPIVVRPHPPIVVPAQAGTSPSATRTSAHPTHRRGGSRTARPARAGLPLRHQQPSPARPPPPSFPLSREPRAGARRGPSPSPVVRPPSPPPSYRRKPVSRGAGQGGRVSMRRPRAPNASFRRKPESRGARKGREHARETVG